jgi:hypothetical protein
MPAPLRRLRIAVFCLLAFTSLTLMSYSQNVTTWHNDINRTGWQQNETTLCASAQTGCTPVTQSSFGLLWQWNVTGRVRPAARRRGRINKYHWLPTIL